MGGVGRNADRVAEVVEGFGVAAVVIFYIDAGSIICRPIRPVFEDPGGQQRPAGTVKLVDPDDTLYTNRSESGHHRVDVLSRQRKVTGQGVIREIDKCFEREHDQNCRFAG